MKIEEVAGGVGGDVSQQAIQLRMRAAGQNFVGTFAARLKAWDATGTNPVTLIVFPSNVANGATGARILVVSPAFAAGQPGISADFTMTSLIPPSYLAAGRLTFEDGGGTVLWSLAWGGAGYTGPNTGSLFNDADGNYGPPFGSALPSSSTQALRFSAPDAAGTALGTSNLADYAVTPGAAVFTNNAGTSGSVTAAADLSISKTDGQATAFPGQAATYTIVASNAGPSAVNGAAVTDVVPAALTDVAWTCVGSGGGTCTSKGLGDINDLVNLPVGATVTYTLRGTISDRASGTLTNSAQISAPAGMPDPVGANNTASDSDTLLPAPPAKNVLIGSTSSGSLGAPPNDHNRFRYRVRSGRSYCVEVDNGAGETSIRDTVLSVHGADGTTLIASNDDIADEPGGPHLSRACYVATANEADLADVTAGTSGTAGGFRLRVVETTLFCPWLGPLFAGGGFESFILIKNTTGTAHSATVTLTTGSGSTVGTPQNGVVPANGSYNLQVSAAPPVGFGLSGVSAGVLIAHDGPPGGVIANVTTLNFGSGVSYDTPALPRLDNRP
jgi:uncharacterized repeat protein (TIGR01451 family)